MQKNITQHRVSVKTLMRYGVLIASLSVCHNAMAIKKCKDANGKWHYGDIAVEECENSKITTLNDRGFITETEEAPLTEQELAEAQKEAELIEAEERRQREENEERLRILSIYETEDDIDRQRDNQLNAVQGNIAVHRAYLKSMKTRVERYKAKQIEVSSKKLKDDFEQKITQASLRIQTSEKELIELLEQKQAISDGFAREKELYRSLKGESDRQVDHTPDKIDESKSN